jgi:hypothetical protein
MGRGLLVAHQDVADIRIVMQGIMDQEAPCSGITEYRIHPLPFQTLKKDLCSDLHGIALLSLTASLSEIKKAAVFCSAASS